MAGRLRTANKRLVYAPYDPSSLAIFAAFTTPPTEARKILINACVVALKAAGVWPLLDVLQMYAAADSQAAIINWARPETYNAVTVNNPTFVANRGINGDGSTSYIDMGFNPTTAVSPGFVRDSASFTFWKRSADAPAVAIGGAFISGIGGTSINISPLAYRINTGTSFDAAVYPQNYGLIAANRSAAAATQFYVNGVGTATGTQVSISPLNTGFQLGKVGTTFAATQYSCGVIGASLTPTQHAALYAAINPYMQAVGAA